MCVCVCVCERFGEARSSLDRYEGRGHGGAGQVGCYRIYGSGRRSTTVGTRVHLSCALQAAGTISKEWRLGEEGCEEGKVQWCTTHRNGYTAEEGITNGASPGNDGVRPRRAWYVMIGGGVCHPQPRRGGVRGGEPGHQGHHRRWLRSTPTTPRTHFSGALCVFVRAGVTEVTFLGPSWTVYPACAQQAQQAQSPAPPSPWCRRLVGSPAPTLPHPPGDTREKASAERTGGRGAILEPWAGAGPCSFSAVIDRGLHTLFGWLGVRDWSAAGRAGSLRIPAVWLILSKSFRRSGPACSQSSQGPFARRPRTANPAAVRRRVAGLRRNDSNPFLAAIELFETVTDPVSGGVQIAIWLSLALGTRHPRSPGRWARSTVRG